MLLLIIILNKSSTYQPGLKYQYISVALGFHLGIIMVKRFVGREPFYRGKTLFELCCNLKNFGEGRVLYRHQYAHFPETSYYRLTKVQPDPDYTNTVSNKLNTNMISWMKIN